MRWHVALAVLVTGVVALAVAGTRGGTRAGRVPAPPHGRAARPILAAFDALCASGWIAPWACSARSRIHYELHDDGGGWYRGHHNHLHVSWRP